MAQKPILEENSFMVNYVNSKLAKYDNYDPSLVRPSSAIGMAKAVSEVSQLFLVISVSGMKAKFSCNSMWPAAVWPSL